MALHPITFKEPMLDAAFNESHDRLLNHPIYHELKTMNRVRIFMEQHVFAVWDFMTLLKRLQQMVTCVTTPWLPKGSGELSRFITEVVLGEEADEDGRGGYASHFELYHEAMQECGANVQLIDAFIERVRAGESPTAVLDQLGVARSTRTFVHFNLELARQGTPHRIASAFFFGRENLIPEMFRQLVSELHDQGHRVERLLYYLERHIQLDSDHHGPLARRLVEHFCGSNEEKWREAAETAIGALEARNGLWNGVLAMMQRAGRVPGAHG